MVIKKVHNKIYLCRYALLHTLFLYSLRNSALKIRISTSEFEVHEKMYDAQVYARAYNIPLKNAVEGKLIETSIDMPDSQSAWIDMANSYVYGGSSSYPITYLDYTAQNIVSPYLNFSNKKLYVMQKGNWSGYQAWIMRL